MGEVSLDMVWKRLEEMQADLKAVRADVADLKETARVLAKADVAIQRDLSILKDRVTILTVAFGEQPPAHA
jgi:hypothetical protein